MPIIEASGLTKVFRQPQRRPGLAGALRHLVAQEYREHVAVDHVDLRIDVGESVAYVGPNGAGKSTTIKMLTGVLVPSAGQIVVDGRVPHEQREANARAVGVVFGQRTQLWWDLPLVETFGLLRDIYDLPEAEYTATLNRFVALLGMDEFLGLAVRKLSLGQRMRADLAAALLHRPRIIFLDEPTIGLDIAVKLRIREFLRQINAEEQTTILLTTHDLGDIEDICRRLIIIDKGRIIYDGSLAAIKQTFARERILHLQLRAPAPDLGQAVADLPGIVLEAGDELDVQVRFDREQIAAGDLIATLLRHADIADLRIDEPGITQIIRQVYEGTLRLA